MTKKLCNAEAGKHNNLYNKAVDILESDLGNNGTVFKSIPEDDKPRVLITMGTRIPRSVAKDFLAKCRKIAKYHIPLFVSWKKEVYAFKNNTRFL